MPLLFLSSSCFMLFLLSLHLSFHEMTFALQVNLPWIFLLHVFPFIFLQCIQVCDLLLQPLELELVVSSASLAVCYPCAHWFQLRKAIPSVFVRWIWDWTKCLFMSLPLSLCLRAFEGWLLSFHRSLTLELPNRFNRQCLKYFECASKGSVGCCGPICVLIRSIQWGPRVSRCVSDFVQSPSFCCTLPPSLPQCHPLGLPALRTLNLESSLLGCKASG